MKLKKEEAVKFFEEQGIPSDHYFETSAKTGEGINELFYTAVKFWLRQHEEVREKLSESFHQSLTPLLPKDNCIIA